MPLTAISELLTKIETEVSAGTALLTTGVAAVFLAYRRVMRIAKLDEKSTADSGAHIDVIELLRAEVARLSAQNNVLADLVIRLQAELSQLRDENARILRGRHDR